MKGDYSKDSYDPAKHFTRVLMQQGRVQLDSDWNEQTSILLHYLQSLARDLIGPHGGPKESPGFAISILVDDTSLNVKDLEIGRGRYYVDGILCETDDLEATPPLSYFSQPFLPRDRQKPEDKLPDLPLLVYLDVWERHICALEDDSIREVALGGPDTAARAKIVWQVKLVKLEGSTVDLTCANFEETTFWKDLRNSLQPAERGFLKARAQLPEDSDNVCIVAPEARYRGAENQLYRVEIHRGGELGNATFVYSRENGAVSFAIKNFSDRRITLENLGRDDRFGLEVGDWVEVVDERYTLRSEPAPLLRVEDIEPTRIEVTLSAPSPIQGAVDRALLRRWDHQAGVPASGGLELQDGAALVREGVWLNLEDGIQIQFQPGGKYRAGDYWLIPARTETGDVEWPGLADNPEALPPHGVEHHYAPLALVFKNNGPAKQSFATTDLRHHFGPAAQCCPTLTLDHPTTSPRNSKIPFAVLVQPQPAGALTFKWEVTGGTFAPGSKPSEITVTADSAADAVQATVTITGLSPFCPNTAQGICRILPL